MASGLRRAWQWLAAQSDGLQSAVCVGATAALLPALPTLSPAVLATVNLVAISTQFGSQVYVAFVGGPTMFVHLPRVMFGDIQARLFPKFGMVGMSTGLLAISSYHLAHNSVDTCSLLLASSTLISFVNSFLIFPLVTQYMLELRKHEEGTEGRKKAGMRFGITHGISNLINLASMGCNLAYIAIIASRVAGHW